MKSLNALTKSTLTKTAILAAAILLQNCAPATKVEEGTETIGASVSVMPDTSCTGSLGTNQEWSSQLEIQIDGYTGNAMEPQVSADEVVLFFNDKPASDTQMNIHYAIRQPTGRYAYAGVLPGTVDNNELDGAPSIDANGNFYFVSLRSYAANLQTVYSGTFQVTGPGTGQIVNLASADDNVAEKVPGRLDMGVDVSWDGATMLASRTLFAGNPYPEESRLAFFHVSNRKASANPNSDTLLANVNRADCLVYAASLSQDLKELYYTVLPTNHSTSTEFRVVVAKRASLADPFGPGAAIAAIQGEVTEAPSISYDGKSLYFHKFDSRAGYFRIYRLSRP